MNSTLIRMVTWDGTIQMRLLQNLSFYEEAQWWERLPLILPYQASLGVGRVSWPHDTIFDKKVPQFTYRRSAQWG